MTTGQEDPGLDDLEKDLERALDDLVAAYEKGLFGPVDSAISKEGDTAIDDTGLTSLAGPDNGNFRWLTLPDVVKPETVRLVETSLGLRGWHIADRWASGSTRKVKALEASGRLIEELRAQETLENQTISDARVGGRSQDVPDSEILAMYEIPLLPEESPKATSPPPTSGDVVEGVSESTGQPGIEADEPVSLEPRSERVLEPRVERPVRVRLPGGPFVARSASGPSGGWIEVFDPASKSWTRSFGVLTFGDLMEGEPMSDEELAALGMSSGPQAKS